MVVKKVDGKDYYHDKEDYSHNENVILFFHQEWR